MNKIRGSGGIGRRAGLRIQWLCPCGFKSHLPHIFILTKTMWYLLLKIKPRLIKRLLFRKSAEHWAKVGVALAVIGLFFWGAYEIFYRIFDYLTTVQDIGLVLTDRIISIGFLAFFAMLIISNLVSSISTLFRSAETEYLMSTPLSHSSVFWSRFVDNFFYSSWATAVICFPMTLAYIVVHKLPLWQSIIAGVMLLLFLIIPAYIGAVGAMILFVLTKKLSFKKTVAIIVIISAVLIYFYIKTNISGTVMFNVMGDLSVLNYYLRQLGSYRYPYFPHVWFAEVLRNLRLGNWTLAWLFGSAMVSTSFFGFFVTDQFARWIYFPAFEVASSLSTSRKARMRSIFRSAWWKILSPFQPPVRAMLVKDIKLFLRDPSQWSQFTVILVLVAVYMANLRFVPSRVESLFWQTVVSFVNYAFCGYILATLSVRFVYPAISMEGKSFWSIVSSPLKLKTLFWEKFALAFMLFFLVAEALAIVSNSLLAQSSQMMLITAVGILLMSISLVSLNVGLGILFPNFDELNPMRIASSGGGMIAALLSLAYVGIMVVIAALPTYRYASRAAFGETLSSWEIISSIVAMVVINLAATIIPLRLGLKNIGKREF